MKRAFPPLLAFCLAVALLEGAVRFEWVNAALIPAPSDVFRALAANSADYRRATSETFLATFGGFLGAAVLGFSLALVFSLSPWLRRAILPFAIFFQTVPIIAVAPLLVIYFGFGLGTVVASSLVVSIFPVLANTLLGLESVDPGLLELFAVAGASPWQVLWKLKLPAAYPQIYGGLKIAAGLSVIGTVAGEFVAGGGLGAMIDTARTQQRIDLVFGALLLLSLLGWFFVGLLRFVNARVQRYRPYGLNLRD